MKAKSLLIFLALPLLVGVAAFSQQQSHHPNATVKVLPPEPFPVGTCETDASGYLATTKSGETETHLTDKQLGEYVRIRLSQGYSVALYPQVSGKIFVIATCESSKR